jgi:SIR2-like domain
LDELIKAIPDFPAGLKQAQLLTKLVPFVGAGASMIAGCPNWSTFADGALAFFVQNGKFTHAQIDQIRHLSPRIKLSIARSLERQHGLPITFGKILYPNGKDNEKGEKGRRLYASLGKLAKTFVTTNYDDWLDEPVIATAAPSVSAVPATVSTSATTPATRQVFHRIHDFTPFNLNQPDTVFHLHGWMHHALGMIMTTQDYVEHYKNDRMQNAGEENNVLTFLDHLFREKTVLFIGYSLDELEILEYVIVKARLRQKESAASETEISHHILQGFFSHEQVLMENMRLYFAECGIGLIPFLRDEKNYDQLIEVLEAFAREAPASEPLKLAKLAEMEGLLDR